MNPFKFRFPASWLIAAGGVALIALVAARQLASGAYSAELTGYPDEIGHFITGVMVNQFFRAPQGHLINFATDFYKHYSFVAIGHWPPFLYILSGSWMLIFGVSRFSAFLFQGLLAFILLMVVWRQAARHTTPILGFVAAVTLGAIPIMENAESQIMAESLVAITCLLAAWALICYLESEQPRYMIFFAGWTLACIMTKGSGWILLAVPLLTFALTGRLRLVRRREFWIALLIVGAVCVPWQMATRKLVQNGWENANPGIRYILEVSPAIPRLLWTTVGLGAAILCAVYLGKIAFDLFSRRALTAFEATHVSLIVMTVALNIAAPTGLEDRKFITAIPSIIILANLMIFKIGSSAILREYRGPVWAALSVVLIGSALLLPRPQFRHSYGFKEAAQFIQQRVPELSGVLIASNGSGEGIMTAEVALLNPKPRIFVIRTSKILASISWTGNDYKLLYHSAQSADELIDRIPVSWVLLDPRNNAARLPHTELVREVVSNSSKWRLQKVFHGDTPGVEDLQLYERITGPNAVRGFRIDMTHMLDRVLEVQGQSGP